MSNILDIPNKCKECGSKESLKWSAGVRNSGGCEDGRIKLNEVSPIFILGCDNCSATIRIVYADVVANYITKVKFQEGIEAE